MKYLLLTFFIFFSLDAQSFSEDTLQGRWELSSAQANKSVAFINYIGQERNEVLELLFNKRGQMKILKTDEVYNYEIKQGKLKVYETKVYKNNYIVKQKHRYDLFQIIGSIDGCKLVRLEKKKIPGYNPKRDLKMCKIANYPKVIYQDDKTRYDF